jgi:hypothetical protein
MDKITRRATSRVTSNDASGLASAEAGQHYASDRIHSSVPVGLAGRPQRRHRNKSSLFMKKLQKKIALFLRRNALSRTALISSVAGVFLVAIVAVLGLTTIFHSRLENLPMKESIKERLHPPEFLAPSISFDIILRERTLMDGFDIVAFPPKLTVYYAEEGESEDFGGLKIEFFAEDGDKRNIMYDSRLSKSDPRSKDDDHDS